MSSVVLLCNSGLLDDDVRRSDGVVVASVSPKSVCSIAVQPLLNGTSARNGGGRTLSKSINSRFVMEW